MASPNFLLLDWKKCSIKAQCFRHDDTFPLAYFNDVHRAHEIGVETCLHVLRTGLQQGLCDHNSCVVNQQVETPRRHQRVHLLGTLFYARKVRGIWRREKESGATAVRESDKYHSITYRVKGQCVPGHAGRMESLIDYKRVTESIYQDVWWRWR